jgi:4-hydroxyacetophenone monooxygenase
VTVPGFPNLFCLYGPNTNIVINGSIVYFSECGVRYILGCLRMLLEGKHRALEVRKDVTTSSTSSSTPRTNGWRGAHPT